MRDPVVPDEAPEIVLADGDDGDPSPEREGDRRAPPTHRGAFGDFGGVRPV